MSVVVLLLICLHHETVHASGYTSTVSNNDHIQDQKQGELAVGKTITENQNDNSISTETQSSDETKATVVKPDQTSSKNVDSSEKTNNNKTDYDYTEPENSTEINIYPYTDKDGLTDVVADNGIKYESSASDNFVLPGHEDDEGNFAGITDDSEPMHYYVSEEGDLSGKSDAIGIEVLLPDYVKPTRKSDDDYGADSGETTTVDEDLILPDSDSVETTTMPTTEATTWFYHSWEFRGENFEIKEDEITTVKPIEQEYVDEDEQTPDLKTDTNITLSTSEETVTKSQKLSSQPNEEDKYEKESVNEDIDDVFDYKNLMADDSQGLEQTTSDTKANQRNMEKYVISFDKGPFKVVSYKSSSDIASKRSIYSKSSAQSSGSSEIPFSRIKRENKELEPKLEEEGNEDEQELVTESTVPETTRIWRWPTHSWENHGDMYEPSSPETTTATPTDRIRSSEEMEYSEEDISVADNMISFSGRPNSNEHKFHKPPQSVLIELNKDGNGISDNRKTPSSTTEESQYGDVTPANFPGFDEEQAFNRVNKDNFFTNNIGSPELLISSNCLIEWENCESDSDCCRPFFCSTLPRFPVIENADENSTLEIGQFCSRFRSNALGDLKNNNRIDLLNIIESYKRRILRLINS